MDSLTHQVVALTPPAAPSLSLSHASHHALNLTITPAGDGGAPIMGACLLDPYAILLRTQCRSFKNIIHINQIW